MAQELGLGHVAEVPLPLLVEDLLPFLVTEADAELLTFAQNLLWVRRYPLVGPQREPFVPIGVVTYLVHLIRQYNSILSNDKNLHLLEAPR